MFWNVSDKTHVDIDTVFRIIDLNNEETRIALSPNIVSHHVIKKTPHYIDSIFKQSIKNKDEIVHYNVHVTHFKDLECIKVLGFKYNYKDDYEFSVVYTLTQEKDGTLITCQGSKHHFSPFKRLFHRIFLSTDGQASSYLGEVKKIAEEKY